MNVRSPEYREYMALLRKENWRGNFALPSAQKKRLEELKKMFPPPPSKHVESKEDIVMCLKQELERLKKDRSAKNRADEIRRMLGQMGEHTN